MVYYNPYIPITQPTRFCFIAQVDFSGLYHLIKDMFTKVEGWVLDDAQDQGGRR